MTDSWQQQLFADGVCKSDFLTKRHLYQSDPQCAFYFNLDNQDSLPNLLKCGHVSCNECVALNSPCLVCHPIPDSKAPPKQVKIPGYKKLLQKVSSNHYVFSVMIGSVTLLPKTVCGDTTFGELLMQYPDFVRFQEVAKNGTHFNLYSKAFLFHKVKDHQIKKYKSLLYDSSSGRANRISIVNRNLGGNQ